MVTLSHLKSEIMSAAIHLSLLYSMIYCKMHIYFSRLGNAQRKLGKLAEAKVAFEKAMTEHRTPDYRQGLSEVESELKKAEELAYINPEIAEQEKLKGNDCFKKGEWANAVKFYSEAIKRNPKDAKIYSNRAACYTKLMSFDLAMAAYEKVLEMDPNCSEAVEGYKNCSIQSHNDPEETRKRAMKDPEVQQILQDPAMRMILEQMQSDPQAIQEHLQNPEISAKFMKLREAGLISVAYR